MCQHNSVLSSCIPLDCPDHHPGMHLHFLQIRLFSVEILSLCTWCDIVSSYQISIHQSFIADWWMQRWVKLLEANREGYANRGMQNFELNGFSLHTPKTDTHKGSYYAAQPYVFLHVVLCLIQNSVTTEVWSCHNGHFMFQIKLINLIY